MINNWTFLFFLSTGKHMHDLQTKKFQWLSSHKNMISIFQVPTLKYRFTFMIQFFIHLVFGTFFTTEVFSIFSEKYEYYIIEELLKEV